MRIAQFTSVELVRELPLHPRLVVKERLLRRRIWILAVAKPRRPARAINPLLLVALLLPLDQIPLLILYRLNRTRRRRLRQIIRPGLAILNVRRNRIPLRLVLVVESLRHMLYHGRLVNSRARSSGKVLTEAACAAFCSAVAFGSNEYAGTPAFLLSVMALSSASSADTGFVGSRDASKAPCCLISASCAAVAMVADCWWWGGVWGCVNEAGDVARPYLAFCQLACG